MVLLVKLFYSFAYLSYARYTFGNAPSDTFVEYPDQDY